MKAPKIQDWDLKSIKITNNNGAEIEYSNMYSEHNQVHTDTVKIKRSLKVHKDLFSKLQEQKQKLLTIRDIDPRVFPKIVAGFGGNEEEKVTIAAEELRKQLLNKIGITGFSISGVEGKRKCNIKYKYQEANKKIIGSTTTAIQLNGKTFGFEEELSEELDEIKKEVYEYVFNNKHSESEQYILFPSDEDQEEMNEEISDDQQEKVDKQH